MALETLKDVKEINGEKIVTIDEDFGAYVSAYLRDGKTIAVDHSINTLSFRIQNGPIKEVGKNGCQVTDIVAVALHIFKGLNAKFPCTENEGTIACLETALNLQQERTAKREARGVEGRSEA